MTSSETNTQPTPTTTQTPPPTAATTTKVDAPVTATPPTTSSPEAKAPPEKPEGREEKNPQSTKETEPTTETKDPATKDGEGEGKKDEGEESGETDDDVSGKEEGAPEKYDLAVPENSSIEAEDLAEFEQIARKNGWSNEKAQGFLDEQAKKLDDRVNARKEAWRKEVEKDPDFAGAKFTEAVGHADRAIEAYFGAEFRTLLDRSGYGNHPAVIKGLSRIGQGLANDTIVIGTQKPKRELSQAERIYGPNDGQKD